MNIIISIVAFIGLLVAVSALFAQRSNTKSWCDFNANWNCSKVLNSSYGVTFGIHNTLWGIAYYIVIIALAGLELLPVALLLSLFSVIISLYLLKKQLRLKKQCILCWASYVVNVLLFVVIYLDTVVLFLP